MWNWLRRAFKPPTPRKAFDVSNFWGASEPVAAMRSFKDAGFSGVMIGVYHLAEDIAWTQYVAAHAAGLWTDTYAYLYFDADDHIRLEACSGLPGGICWIDCELTDGPINEMSQAEVRWLIWQRGEWARAMGMTPGIYSRKAWWVPYTGDEKWFAENGYLLWDANDQAYDPYGGWAKPTWTQYAWDVKVNGVNVDLSIEGGV